MSTTKKFVANKITCLLGVERQWTTIARAWDLAERFRIAIRPTADGWIASATKSIAVAYHEDAAMAICLAVLRMHNVEILESSSAQNPPEKTTAPVRLPKRTDLVRCATYACSNWTEPESLGPDNKPICAECQLVTKNTIWTVDNASVTPI